MGLLDQPDFLNAVVALDVPAGPDADTGAATLLAALKHIELALGRQQRERWGPREIDLDVLVFGRSTVKTQLIDVPHPRMSERLFVLAPLADLAPRLRPPGWSQSIDAAREQLAAGDGPAVERVAEDWL